MNLTRFSIYSCKSRVNSLRSAMNVCVQSILGSSSWEPSSPPSAAAQAAEEDSKALMHRCMVAMEHSTIKVSSWLPAVIQWLHLFFLWTLFMYMYIFENNEYFIIVKGVFLELIFTIYSILFVILIKCKLLGPPWGCRWITGRILS